MEAMRCSVMGAHPWVMLARRTKPYHGWQPASRSTIPGL
jgi:hypothetical protein